DGLAETVLLGDSEQAALQVGIIAEARHRFVHEHRQNLGTFRESYVASDVCVVLPRAGGLAEQAARGRVNSVSVLVVSERKPIRNYPLPGIVHLLQKLAELVPRSLVDPVFDLDADSMQREPPKNRSVTRWAALG